MNLIDIRPVPNQSFTVNVGGHRYDITLHFIEPGAMAYDVVIDEQPIVTGQRVIVGQMMLPYRYMEANGNFLLYVPDSDLPDYNQFGNSQLLYYLTRDEADEVRASGY